MSRTRWALAALLIAAGCGGGTDSKPVAPPTVPAPAPPPPPPGQPTGIREMGRGPDYIGWAWDSVEGATGYEADVFPAGTPPGQRGEPIVTEEPRVRAKGLEPATAFEIYVRAVRETADGRAVGPWSERSPVVETLPDFPNDPRFERAFWRELVFNAHDCPRAGCGGSIVPAVEERVTWVLATTSPNFYIRTHDDEGNRTFSSNEIRTMRREIPRITQALTGEPYRGQIVEGEEDRDSDGWITVREVPPNDRGSCGGASVGASAGHVGMVGPGAPRGCGFRDTFIHEVGHAMGFHHVSNPREVMFSGGEDVSRFSAREIYHARLAYKIGRWFLYLDDRTYTAPQQAGPNDPEPPIPRIVVCRPEDF